MNGKIVMELRTFKLGSNINPKLFAKRDAQVERDFISKQAGFIRRHRGVDEKGNYIVVVYWEDIVDADVSMSKLMTDVSIADYSQMIEASSMKIFRYTMDKPLDADAERIKILNQILWMGEQ